MGYEPCDINGGNDVDEKFEVDNPDDLIGMKDLYFKILIKNAIGLPKDLA